MGNTPGREGQGERVWRWATGRRNDCWHGSTSAAAVRSSSAPAIRRTAAAATIRVSERASERASLANPTSPPFRCLRRSRREIGDSSQSKGILRHWQSQRSSSSYTVHSHRMLTRTVSTHVRPALAVPPPSPPIPQRTTDVPCDRSTAAALSRGIPAAAATARAVWRSSNSSTGSEPVRPSGWRTEPVRDAEHGLQRCTGAADGHGTWRQHERLLCRGEGSTRGGGTGGLIFRLVDLRVPCFLTRLTTWCLLRPT